MFALTISQPSKKAIRMNIDEVIIKAKATVTETERSYQTMKQSSHALGKPTVRERKITLMDKPSEYVNYDTTHKELENYQYLRNQIFTGPKTGRPNVVVIICYDKKTKEPVAYR